MAGWHCKEVRQTLAAAAVPGELTGPVSTPREEPRRVRRQSTVRRLDGSGPGRHRTAGPAYPDGNDAPESGGGRLELVCSNQERCMSRSLFYSAMGRHRLPAATPAAPR